MKETTELKVEIKPELLTQDNLLRTLHGKMVRVVTFEPPGLVCGKLNYNPESESRERSSVFLNLDDGFYNWVQFRKDEIKRVSFLHEHARDIVEIELFPADDQ